MIIRVWARANCQGGAAGARLPPGGGEAAASRWATAGVTVPVTRTPASHLLVLALSLSLSGYSVTRPAQARRGGAALPGPGCQCRRRSGGFKLLRLRRRRR